jgi:hypothetical protein
MRSLRGGLIREPAAMAQLHLDSIAVEIHNNNNRNDNNENAQQQKERQNKEKMHFKNFFQPIDSSTLIPCCYDHRHLLLKGDHTTTTTQDNNDDIAATTLSTQTSIATLTSTVATEDASHPSTLQKLPQHPAVKGLHLSCHALAILDTYCSSKSPFAKYEEWESLFISSNANVDGNVNVHACAGIVDDKEEGDDGSTEEDDKEALITKKASIRVGMKYRNITLQLLQSWENFQE